MRFWVLVLAVLLLPLRAWTGDAMALQMATQALAAGTSGPARQLVPATHEGHVLRTGRTANGASVALSTMRLHHAGAGTERAAAGHLGHTGDAVDAHEAHEAHGAGDGHAIHASGAGADADATVDAPGLNRTDAAVQAHVEGGGEGQVDAAIATAIATDSGTDAAAATDATPCASTCGDCQLCHGLMAGLDIAPLPFMPLPHDSPSRVAGGFSSLAPAPSLRPPIA